MLVAALLGVTATVATQQEPYSHTLSLAAAADQYWSTVDPAASYASSNTLRVKRCSPAVGCTSANDLVSAIKFDFSAVDAYAVSTGCVISVSDSRVGFHVKDNAIEGMQLYSTASSWSEGTMSGPPAFDALPTAILDGTLAAETTHYMDATPLTRATYNAGEAELSLGLRTTHDRASWDLRLDSKECTPAATCVPPFLLVTLTVTCGAPWPPLPSPPPPMPPVSPPPVVLTSGSSPLPPSAPGEHRAALGL